jgi:hypothetical protein
MLGGAFALASGLDLLRGGAAADWPMIAAIAGGTVALATGVALELWLGPKARRRKAPAPTAAPGPGTPLGTATLAFDGHRAPRLVSANGAVEILAERDGTVRFTLKDGRKAGRLICRAEGAAYFNTLRQDSRQAAIKLLAPMPEMVRLEVWDREDSRARA